MDRKHIYAWANINCKGYHVPVFLIFIALIFGAAAVNGKVPELGQVTNATLFGPPAPGLLKWVGAILVIAGLMSTIDLPGAGKAFIVLLIVAFVLGHGDLPEKVLSSIKGISPP
jgi:hypothetical protein